VKYRPEVDGLRAVAVVPVVLFHAGLPGFDGGYLGVDVFLVISGYLITTIILDDIAAERFSVLTFYEQRFRRILPAYVVMVLACMVPALAWMMPDEFRNFGQSVFASAIFSSNILFWTEAGYFSVGSELKPLLHTWSLSVEEQFYSFFPLMLVALVHLRWRWTVLAIALITISSLGLSELSWRRWPTSNFYLLPFRAWELGIGAMVSILIRLYAPRPNQLLSGAGFLMLAASLALFDDTTPMPSVYGLAPVIGTALVILFAASSTWVGRVLSLKPVVFIGLISYSTYLWHQPLLAFTRIRAIPSASEFALACAVIASFLFGYLSWRYIEQPFRKGGYLFTLPRTSILTGGLAALACLAAIGLSGHFADGFPQRLTDRALKLAAFVHDRNPLENGENCAFWGTHTLPKHPTKKCDDFLIDGHADVVFIGDSHSGTMSYDAQQALLEIGIPSYAVTYSGCMGLRGFRHIGMPVGYDCNAYNEGMIAFARKTGARVLVVTSRFPLYLYGTRFDNHEGGLEEGHEVHYERAESDAGSSMRSGASREEKMLYGITEELVQLTSEFSVVLLDPIPEAGWYVPQLAAKIARFGDEDDFKISTDRARYDDRAREVISAFDAVESNRLFRVRPQNALCDRPKPGRCINGDQDNLYYFDDNHLSRTGAKQIVPALLSAVRAALQQEQAEIVRK
jgi:peptidoglycan/LPS O-acetylase OafA/YrhL